MSLLRRNGNIFYGMGRRKRVHRRPRRYGGSFLSNVHDFIKRHKIISTVGNALGAVGVPYASAVGKAAGVLGYGRRRRRIGRPRRRIVRYGLGRRRVYRRRRGGDIKSILSSAHKFVKDRRLVSSALKHFGHHKLASAASTLGYGRRRRRVVRRRRRHGGSLRSIASSVHKFVKDKRLVSSALRHFAPHSNLHKAAHVLGYGRRRTMRRRPIYRHHGGANFFSTEQIAAPKF